MKQIIIIDDDPGVQDIFKLIFSSEHYRVIIYQNAKAVINQESIVPDIYIIDKQLPGVDGLDVCRFLKNQQQTLKVPVIMMSASPNIHRLAKLAGADGTIEKPFSMMELREMVSSYAPV